MAKALSPLVTSLDLGTTKREQGAEKRSFSLESLIQKVVLRWVYNFREEEGQDLVSLAEDELRHA